MDAYTENTFIVAAVAAVLFGWGMVTGKAIGRPSWLMDRSKSPNYFWVFQIFWATAAIIGVAVGLWHLL